MVLDVSGNPSMRRRPRQERGRQRVDAILDAAAAIFAEVGYEAATTNAIAARARTSIGSLYQFFPDKLAIFRALDARYGEQLRQLSLSAFSPAVARLPLVQMVNVLVDTFAEFQAQPGFKAVLQQSQLQPRACGDDSLDNEVARLLASLFAQRNPNLGVVRCDQLAEVCMHISCSLMLQALRSDEEYRRWMLAEVKVVLVSYLEPHVGDALLPPV